MTQRGASRTSHCDSSSMTVTRLSWPASQSSASSSHSVVDSEKALNEILEHDFSARAGALNLLQMTQHIRSKVRTLRRLQAVYDICRSKSSRAPPTHNSHTDAHRGERDGTQARECMTISSLPSDEYAARLEIVDLEHRKFTDTVATFVRAVQAYLHPAQVRSMERCSSSSHLASSCKQNKTSSLYGGPPEVLHWQHGNKAHKVAPYAPMNVYDRQARHSLKTHTTTSLLSSTSPHLCSGSNNKSSVRSDKQQSAGVRCIRAPYTKTLYTASSDRAVRRVCNKEDVDMTSSFHSTHLCSYSSSSITESASLSDLSVDDCSSHSSKDICKDSTPAADDEAEFFVNKEVELERRIMRQRCLIIEQHTMNFGR